MAIKGTKIERLKTHHKFRFESQLLGNVSTKVVAAKKRGGC